MMTLIVGFLNFAKNRLKLMMQINYDKRTSNSIQLDTISQYNKLEREETHKHRAISY